jgi:hypothetical protein
MAFREGVETTKSEARVVGMLMERRYRYGTSYTGKGVMELKDFVRSVLVDILSGIREAQNTEGVGGFVVPQGIGGHDYPKDRGVTNEALITSTIVQFDIAVTAEDSERTSGEGGLRVAVLRAGVEGESTSRDVRVSRVQFSIPILLPETQRQWHLDAKKAIQPNAV